MLCFSDWCQWLWFTNYLLNVSQLFHQDPSEEQVIPDKQKDDEPSFNEGDVTSAGVSPDSVNPKTPSIDEETSKSKAVKNGKDPKCQEKALKKPDKILPCPRCDSLETKFCYYNNYNVNQPRHFCKSCQRYWTAGGTMRNVPVGAGRRKSKSSTRYRHMSISEALQVAARVDSHNGTPHHYPNPTPNGTVLSFGLKQCDSVPPSVEKSAVILNSSSGYQGQGAANVSYASVEARDDGSSRNLSNEAPLSNLNGIVPQVHCVNSVPWPYSVPIPFYPPPPTLWACGNVGIPSAWNFPLLSPPTLIAGPNPPILGKHLREGDPAEAGTPVEFQATKPKKNVSVLIPKTLRIDDPNEAAKSSIWATLGIKNESGTKGGFFKGCQPKGKENDKDQTAETETKKCRVLCANPAALSRSLNFHENT